MTEPVTDLSDCEGRKFCTEIRPTQIAEAPLKLAILCRPPHPDETEVKAAEEGEDSLPRQEEDAPSVRSPPPSG